MTIASTTAHLIAQPIANEIDFWLRYAAAEGAEVEDRGDQAVVLLPGAVARRLQLPDELVTVTADPEVSREDGAVLLAAGHPLLDEASSRILERGDVGHRYVGWPGAVGPTQAQLLDRARDQFPIDHGRIDLAGQLQPAYLPVLRVGALVTFTIDQSFQEREEICVDARTGAALAADLGRRLAEQPVARADATRPALPYELAAALKRADRLIHERATTRTHALARQAEGGLRDEVAQADAYYEGIETSLVQRRLTAPPERQELFDEQLKTTRLERTRRLREIEEKFHVRHEVRPFRLHLLMAPALAIPVHIRRGERRWPETLAWMLHEETFSPLPCPTCGTGAILVAGRERFGCRRCLPPRAVTAAPPVGAEGAGGVPASAATADAAGASGVPASATTPLTGATGAATAGADVSAHRSATSMPKPKPKPTSPPVKPDLDGIVGQLRHREKALTKSLRQLSTQLWDSAAGLRRVPHRGVAAGSPLAVLYRLYGPTAPLRAVGLPTGMVPTRFRCEGAPMRSVITGFVEVPGRQWEYTLRFGLTPNGEPLLTELLPFPDAFDDMLPPAIHLPPDDISRLFFHVPPPEVPLDPVETVLWARGLPRFGLPLVARCFAVWARTEGREAVVEPTACAAALAYAVSRRSGSRPSKAWVGLGFGVPGRSIDPMAATFDSELKRRGSHPW